MDQPTGRIQNNQIKRRYLARQTHSKNDYCRLARWKAGTSCRIPAFRETRLARRDCPVGERCLAGVADVPVMGPTRFARAFA